MESPWYGVPRNQEMAHYQHHKDWVPWEVLPISSTQLCLREDGLLPCIKDGDLTKDAKEFAQLTEGQLRFEHRSNSKTDKLELEEALACSYTPDPLLKRQEGHGPARPSKGIHEYQKSVLISGKARLALGKSCL